MILLDYLASFAIGVSDGARRSCYVPSTDPDGLCDGYLVSWRDRHQREQAWLERYDSAHLYGVVPA